MAGWLGVVSAEHVARGVQLGIAQTNHGKRSGLARMSPGDWLVYYSPQQHLGERSPVQAFTAIGEIADDRIWQADEGCFKPWRRAVRYRPDAVRVPIADLHGSLDLTAAPNWGYQLRRGLLPLTDRDLAALRNAMIDEIDGPTQPVPSLAVPRRSVVTNQVEGDPGGPGRLATEFETADESPGLLLWRVTNRWQAAQRAALKPHGLTHVQFVLLASLAWLDSDRPVTQKQLADHAETDVMMTSQVLRTLEERGLVRRAPHPDDRRARALAVTDEGRALANHAVAAVEQCDRDFFATLGADVAGLVDLLGRLATSGPH